MSEIPPSPGAPSVSIVVPVYNQARALAETAPAVLAQDYPVEVHYVEDGSTDGSAEFLAGLLAGRPGATLHRHDSNRGRAAARNTGWRAASGEVVLFLDADVRPEAGVARAHAERHRQEGVVGALSHDSPEGLDPLDPFHHYLLTKPGPADLPADVPLPLRYFIIGYTSVRRDALEAVDGFNEGLGYGEDVDLAYRLWSRWPDGLWRAPGAVVHQREVGGLHDRLGKLRAFGSTLRGLALQHPGLLRAAGLEAVASPGARVLLSETSARLVGSVLPHLPTRLQSRAVRYLLACAVASGYRSATS